MSKSLNKILPDYDLNKPFNWHVIPHNIPYKAIMEFGYSEISTNISYLQLVTCKLLPIKNYNLNFYSSIPEDKLIQLDSLPSIAGAPVVNEKMLKILTELCPNDFQALPVYVKNNPEIKRLSEFCNKQYYLINILAEADTMNHEESNFDYFSNPESSGKILGINKLIFKMNCMNGHHLVRDKDCHGLIVASQKLAYHIKQHKINGVDLQPDYLAFGYYGYNRPQEN